MRLVLLHGNGGCSTRRCAYQQAPSQHMKHMEALAVPVAFVSGTAIFSHAGKSSIWRCPMQILHIHGGLCMRHRQHRAECACMAAGGAQQYPAADAGQGAAADAGHLAGRKEMPERQPVEQQQQQQQQQQQSPAAEAGTQEAAKPPEGHTDPATAARDRPATFPPSPCTPSRP